MIVKSMFARENTVFWVRIGSNILVYEVIFVRNEAGGVILFIFSICRPWCFLSVVYGFIVLFFIKFVKWGNIITSNKFVVKYNFNIYHVSPVFFNSQMSQPYFVPIIQYLL